MPQQSAKEKEQHGLSELTSPATDERLERGLRVLARAIASDLLSHHKPSSANSAKDIGSLDQSKRHRAISEAETSGENG